VWVSDVFMASVNSVPRAARSVFSVSKFIFPSPEHIAFEEAFGQGTMERQGMAG